MTTRLASEAAARAASKPQQAWGRATEVGHEATQAGSQVAQEAAVQSKHVAAEAGRQARDLVGEASAQVRQQAGAQQKRAADGLRAIGTQLQSMATKSEQDGVAKEMVYRASDAAQRGADWLERREPGEMVAKVRDYARHHPGAFLAGAAVAGLLVGRLTRGLTAGGDGLGGAAAQPEQGGQVAGMPSVPSTAGRATGGATTDIRTPDRGES
jgi:hypothetical protein